MITLAQLRERVRARVATHARPWGELEDDIVLATLLEVDLHVDDKGEVYSPVPPPNPLPAPRETGAHWLGSGKGRRGEGGRRRRR